MRFIQRAKSLGFSLDEVRDVLRLRERGQVSCERVLALLDRKVLEALAGTGVEVLSGVAVAHIVPVHVGGNATPRLCCGSDLLA